MSDKDLKVGNWVVRPQRLCIERGHTSTHVKPKSMAVLQCLARAEGQVVSRNDILDEVWPGADVTDDVLTHCVTELRKAFGDSPQDHRVIETIPKKGLRLMLEVTWVGESVRKSSETGARWSGVSAEFRIGPLLAVVIIAGLLAWFFFVRDGGVQTGTAEVEKLIAVLPFVDMSPAKDQQYLADGVAEEISGRLSRIEGLLVFGPRRAFLLTGAESDQRTDPQQYSAEYLLNGSVRKFEGRLRITITLDEARNGLQVWSHTFDRPYADIFAVQDEIAAAVAKALSVELGVGHAESRIGSTSNLAAYEQVLRGDSYFDLMPSGLEKALSHYRNAIELDPDYALAWMRIAWYYGAIQYVTDPSEADEHQKLAEEAIARALELAPESEYVLLSAAEVHFMRQDWIEARHLYDRAKAILDRRANTVFAGASMMNTHVSMLLKLGYMSEQVRLLERVSQGRRLEGLFAHFLPQAYLSAGRTDDALAALERAFTESRAGPHVSYVGVSVALTLDDPALIRVWSQRVLEDGGAEAIKTMLDLLGDRERALAWLREAYETDPGHDDIVIVWGSYYGDDELALKAMRRSMDLWFFWMPLTARLRETEEFKSIVVDVGLVDYWREFGWNDYCKPAVGDDFECH